MDQWTLLCLCWQVGENSSCAQHARQQCVWNSSHWVATLGTCRSSISCLVPWQRPKTDEVTHSAFITELEVAVLTHEMHVEALF